MNTQEEQPAPEESADSEPQQVGAGIDYTDPNSPLARYYCRLSHIFAVGFLVLVFLFFGLLTPLSHTDIWAHLKYGEWIVTQRAFPEKELFSSFSDQEQPYWNFPWLAQVLYYEMYHAGALLAKGNEVRQTAGGVEMLRSFHGLLIALKFAFLLLAMWRSTKSLPIALAGSVLLLILVMMPSRIQRPQVFGELFFAMLVWWMSGARPSRTTWFALPILFVLWANCHGSFVIGYLFLVLFWFGRIVESAWNGTLDRARFLSPDSWSRQGLLAILLTPIAVALLNPQGVELYANVLKLGQHPNIRTISEWAPLSFSLGDGPHWFYLGSLAVIVISQIVSPRALGFAQLLVLLAFVIGPLYQQRMLTWWLILVPWFAVSLWKHALALAPRSWHAFRSVASLRKTMIAAMLVLIGVSWSGFGVMLTGRDPMPLTSSVTHVTLWPLALELKYGKVMPKFAEALKDYPNRRFQGRMFVQDHLADYLLWSLPSKAPLLVYNHAHVFPEEVWQHQKTILSAAPGWDSLLDRYQVNLIAFNPLEWPDLVVRLRADPAWIVVIDEAAETPTHREAAVHDMKLLIAVRKHPIVTSYGKE